MMSMMFGPPPAPARNRHAHLTAMPGGVDTVPEYSQQSATGEPLPLVPPAV